MYLYVKYIGETSVSSRLITVVDLRNLPIELTGIFKIIKIEILPLRITAHKPSFRRQIADGFDR